MTTMYRYTLPVEQTGWRFEGESETAFAWEYDPERENLLSLYNKGKQLQWDSDVRIDWSLPVDPEDPMQLDDKLLPLFGSHIWDKMTEKERVELRYHNQAYSLSQFLHGEQGALICAARIVQSVPDIDAKFYAATQVMDEARHVEVYKRLLHEKYQIVYPMTKPLQILITQALTDKRWDFTYLAMQVLIEGLALAAFQRMRDYSKNKLCASVNAYVMQDEARHVAFGRMALRDYYPQLTDAERREREDFVIEGSWLLRDRFDQMEVWERLGLPRKECAEVLRTSENMGRYRSRLFSRIVPVVKEIGLWSEKVQQAYTEIGVMKYADYDAQALLDKDAKVAEEFDAQMFVKDAITLAKGREAA
jgi:hypothetical protein